jgi:hypothetical protein
MTLISRHDVTKFRFPRLKIGLQFLQVSEIVVRVNAVYINVVPYLAYEVE